MEYTHLKLIDDRYIVTGSSNDEMAILATFFTSEVSEFRPYWDEWILDEDEDSAEVNGNITGLEKVGDDVYLEFLYDERPESKRTKLKIRRDNLVQLLIDWREKVCKTKPQYVVITEKDDVFIMHTYETEDTSGLE